MICLVLLKCMGVPSVKDFCIPNMYGMDYQDWGKGLSS